VTVLVQVPGAAEQVRAEVPEVRVVDLLADDGSRDGPAGEVYFGGWDWDLVRRAARRGVRWLQLSGTGIDGVPRDVLESVPVVTCARGASAVPISEFVLGSMLAVAKGFPRHWLTEPPKHWNFQRMDTLAGRMLGIVGFGGIGRAVATRGLAFGMDVRVLRRRPEPADIDGVTIVSSLDALLPVADHLVLAAPATARTRGMLGSDELARVKPGVHVVNIARGSLVDQDALHAALDDGRVGFASLDVCDPEPLPADHWIYSHPRVHLTPHSSWSSPEYFGTAIDLFVANLRRYLAGEELADVVDLDEGY
jgi:phosphoglycerate dehydrogenase-like enzyme